MALAWRSIMRSRAEVEVRLSELAAMLQHEVNVIYLSESLGMISLEECLPKVLRSCVLD